MPGGFGDDDEIGQDGAPNHANEPSHEHGVLRRNSRRRVEKAPEGDHPRIRRHGSPSPDRPGTGHSNRQPPIATPIATVSNGHMDGNELDNDRAEGTSHGHGNPPETASKFRENAQ